MRNSRFLKALKIAIFAPVVIALVSFVVMNLWNALMPPIFGLHTITFWQSLGLLLLSKILFGGFRPHVGGGGPWRRRLRERWEQMTPEEREKFKQGMRRGCGPRQNAEAQA